MRLAEFQALFADGLRHGAMPDALRAEAGAFADRLSIHVHHVGSSLYAALALHFPVTLRLLGEEAFEGLARRFLAASPPADARLALYGSGFAAFLAGEEALTDYPVIAEVAAFEWARHLASIAPRAVPVEPASLDGSARLRLLPGAGLLAADHAVDHVWSVNQPGGDGTPRQRVDVPCRLVVWRDGTDLVRVAPLDPADFTFLSMIAGGASLDEALAAALAEGADLSALLARALGRGLLCHPDTDPRGNFP